MNEIADEATAGPLDDVTDSGVFRAVLDGYDAVYDALPNSRVFTEIWATNAYGADFPDDFAHIGFLTVDEGRHLLQLLRLGGNDVLVDVACGAGGPGLWAAQQTGATLIGVDPSAAGLAAARQRAEHVGLASRATFQQGTFGRDVELQALVQRVIVTDDPRGAAERARESLPELSVEDILASPYLWIGTLESICEGVFAARECWGFSYFTVFDDSIETVTPVVNRLAGT